MDTDKLNIRWPTDLWHRVYRALHTWQMEPCKISWNSGTKQIMIAPDRCHSIQQAEIIKLVTVVSFTGNNMFYTWFFRLLSLLLHFVYMHFWDILEWLVLSFRTSVEKGQSRRLAMVTRTGQFVLVYYWSGMCRWFFIHLCEVVRYDHAVANRVFVTVLWIFMWYFVCVSLAMISNWFTLCFWC